MPNHRGPTDGDKIATHVKLAISQQQKVVEDACELARKAGVGVFIRPIFTEDKIIITAEPSVRVPLGEIHLPDYSLFQFKNGEQ